MKIVQPALGESGSAGGAGGPGVRRGMAHLLLEHPLFRGPPESEAHES
jgi:hypothetical protein